TVVARVIRWLERDVGQVAGDVGVGGVGVGHVGLGHVGGIGHVGYRRHVRVSHVRGVGAVEHVGLHITATDERAAVTVTSLADLAFGAGVQVVAGCTRGRLDRDAGAGGRVAAARVALITFAAA